MRRAGQACLLVSTCGLFAGSLGCTRDEKPERSTFYERQIATVLERSCAPSSSMSTCHGLRDDRGNASGNLNLESYDTLSLRRDLLVNYGPYGVAGLLLKALPPFQLRLTSWDDSEPIFITTDIAHGGRSPIEFEAQAYATLTRWIEGGATENNAPPADEVYEFSGCSDALGRDSLFDPSVAPDTADFDQFR